MEKDFAFGDRLYSYSGLSLNSYSCFGIGYSSLSLYSYSGLSLYSYSSLGIGYSGLRIDYLVLIGKENKVVIIPIYCILRMFYP